MSEHDANAPTNGVAIIGLAGRFPGAPDLQTYWRNLRDGLESITRFTREELASTGFSDQQLADPNFVPARGTLEGVDLFDAPFFGYSPREATIMDPQQRFFLECSWEALESAGYDPKTYRGLIGVYGGATTSSYLPLVYADPHTLAQTDPLSIAIGNEIAFLTTRVSYKLDLRGPSCPVQTACSTALVAIHLACQGLLNAECDLALAGAASIRVPQNSGYHYQPAGILSPDGHCRPFDARAQGTFFSNGIGVVALKRLDDALADGDFIHAVIRGSAVNNDGSQKASFTAPAVGGQSDVIADALMHADVEAETISYLEAHGTATALGDSIEIQALNRVFPTDKARNYCAIGSVKSNFGHLDAAAGVAGLIKTTLAMQHRQLPPSLHFERPNPDIDFASSAFHVNRALTEWKSPDGEPRRAGVSAFGFGGTNAHVVLEEAPALDPSGPSRPWQLLTISADTETGLEAATAKLTSHLRAEPNLSLPDAAYTLKVGRRAFRHRRIVACRHAQEAIAALDARDGSVFSGSVTGAQSVVFLFPGQGAQHVNMARDLYDHEPAFRAIVDQCANALSPALAVDLRDLLYPADAAEAAGERLKQTRYAQPALFVIEYALARLWMQWGIKPEAFIGHSIGEFVAACLAGVMTLDDALALVALRGSLMDQMPTGAMLAIPLAEERVVRFLTPDLWLAAVNASETCVVSGGLPAIDQLERRLQADGITSQRLHTSHAFHSGLMEGAVAPFVAAVSRITLRAPQTPYISNVTGRWIEASQATDPAYWGRQLRQAVRFGDGVAHLLEREQRVFLEVGPGQALSTLVRHQARGRTAQSVFASLRHPRQGGSDFGAMMTALGRMWINGVDVSWTDFYQSESRRRVPMPTYAFDRQRYWIGRSGPVKGPKREERPAGKVPSVGRWFYTPSWTRKTTPPAPGGATERSSGTWLIFADDLPLTDVLVARLRGEGARVILVARGIQFERLADDQFRINPTSAADYRELLRGIGSNESPSILHLWSVKASDADAAVRTGFAEDRTRGFGSLLVLSQTLAEATGRVGTVQIGFVTSGAHDVTGHEPLSPGTAMALGLCHVIPQEQLDIPCKSIDVEAVDCEHAVRSVGLVDRLLREMRREYRDRVVAYRGSHRWTLEYQQVALPDALERPVVLKDRGTYLITGGLGDIGLHVAEYLARTVRGRLVLTGRSAFPAEPQWDGYLAAHDDSDATARQIHRLRRIQALGGEFRLVQADAGDLSEMQRAFEVAEADFGAVNGIVHAAGLVTGDAFRPLADTDGDICRRQFRPKVDGLCVLDVLMADRPAPDFVVLISSLSSVLGGLRFSAYASANAFLDAFAAWRQRTGTSRWLTINWDSWLRAEDEARAGKAGSGANEFFMTGAEGVDALGRIFSTDVGTQVVVSTGDLQARIDQWVALESAADESDAIAVNDGPRHPRPHLQTEYRAPGDPLEQALAGIWQELLGVDRVGVNDSFFELGGDSLLGVQVIARIKKQLAVSVSAVSLYEGPTVALLGNVIRAIGSTAPSESGPNRGDKRREQKLRRQVQAVGGEVMP